MKYYKCGHVQTTHGIKGDLKVRSLSDFDRFYVGARLYILHNGEYVQVKVCKASEFGESYLVAFEGMQDINLVEKFHSDDIYISELDRDDDLEDGEFYYDDLIGKEVVNQSGEARGIVTEVREMPQSHYLVVKNNGKNVLVPFIKEFVVSVDEKIVVNEIEGLF